MVCNTSRLVQHKVQVERPVTGRLFPGSILGAGGGGAADDGHRQQQQQQQRRSTPRHFPHLDSLLLPPALSVCSPTAFLLLAAKTKSQRMTLLPLHPLTLAFCGAARQPEIALRSD